MTNRFFWSAILVTLCFQAGLSYLTFGPTIGFDDANITHSYARNLAAGHGYVYNIGGERVEGSTSALWTVINTAAFLTPYPLVLMQALGVLITGWILVMSGRIGALLYPSVWSAAATVLSFNLFPHFFTWGLFSLMDITLFIAMICCAVTALLVPPKGLGWLWFCLVFLLLPLTRPEGIVVAIGLALYGMFFATDLRARLLVYLSAACLSLVAFGLLTWARLTYFGFPFPNTYYAKTSDDLVGQAIQGIKYFERWIETPSNLAVLILFGVFLALAARTQERRLFGYGWLVAYLFASAVALYTYLGGDHFAGGRFYQFFYPLALPFVVAAFLHVRDAQEDLPRGLLWSDAAIGAILIACVLGGARSFLVNGDGLHHEFRIAKEGKATGAHLAQTLPVAYRLGVVPAGGLRMGYTGDVYDVLGLNWVEMAHAPGEVNAHLPKNHGGFKAGVFYDAGLEVFNPKLSGCDDVTKDTFMGQFESDVLGQIHTTPDFQRLYQIYCDDTVSFFALNTLEADLTEAGFEVVSE